MNTCKDCLHYVICQNNAFKEARFSGKTETVIVSIKHNIACKFFEKKADFVKVVRCKDCEYFEIDEEDELGECKCGYIGLSYNGALYPRRNDYCGYGEEKEVAEI